MRLVIARCSVDYTGRLNTHFPPATRLIMVKADGTVAFHRDIQHQPLNWMSRVGSVRHSTTARTMFAHRIAAVELRRGVIL